MEMDMLIVMRRRFMRRTRQRIISRLVRDAVAAGYIVSVFSDSETTSASSNTIAILQALMRTEEDYLFIYHPDQPSFFGWILLIHDNNVWDVIDCYSPNLDAIAAGAQHEADRLERLHNWFADP
jgi:hypothetical protein